MTLSEEIILIISDQNRVGNLKIKDFVIHFGKRSSAFLIVLLSLPIALPFTPPGINTPFALICIFLGFDIMINKKELTLPNWITDRTVPFHADGKFFNAMDTLLKKIEKIVKLRCTSIFDSTYARFFFGCGIICTSIVMLLPLPIINSVSSLIVLLIGVGLIAKDGLIATISNIVGILLLIISLGLVVYSFHFGISLFK
jgi:hypothetical protein